MQPNNNNNGNNRSAATRGGRNLHIAHRRSPSELTPLMVEQLALQQQIEMLQAQQQQILAQHQQFAQAGLLPPGPMPPQGQQGLMPPPGSVPPPPQPQVQSQPQPPQGQQQQPTVQSGYMASGPFGQFQAQPQQQKSSHHNQNQPSGYGHRRAQSSVTPNYNSERFGHNRRHSLALSEAKKAAALAQAKRQGGEENKNDPTTSTATSSSSTSSNSSNALNQKNIPSFRFPSSPEKKEAPSSFRGHGRSQSMQVGSRFRNPSPQRSFQFPPAQGQNQSQTQGPVKQDSLTPDYNSKNNNSGNNNNRSNSFHQHQRSNSRNFDTNWRDPSASAGFVPGHRSRGSFNNSSISSINFYNQGNNNNNNNNNNGQTRKSLFAPYLPQASLPGLLNEGRLVAGVLRVNRKNRSDAYVSTNGLLDADIFICGSKDRNRALEGDLVAVELLEVDEVWGSKKEKEEKKKRKDAQDDSPNGSSPNNTPNLNSNNDNNNNNNNSTNYNSNNDRPGLRRKGSLKQRPTQKKNDDVEVEGQSLLLVEEEELSDAAKPLYAGHVVAVIERFPGQMFSGSLGLLRPSAQATKDKQDAEHRKGHYNHQHNNQERPADRPKIVWFKPTDKRVPLIAIPTEQAPKDFVQNHENYADKVFIASIKRWPITSLHPFGTLVEELGPSDHQDIVIEAILRDNNFTADTFPELPPAATACTDWQKEGRVDYTNEQVVAFGDPDCASQGIHVKETSFGKIELGVHVADVTEFIKSNSPLDREARKRGTSVFLKQRKINMFPKQFNDNVSLQVGKENATVSVVFTMDGETFEVLDCKMHTSFVKPNQLLGIDSDVSELNPLLDKVAKQLRQVRFNADSGDAPVFGLLNQVDDENVLVSSNIFDGHAVQQVLDEINIKVNTAVAQKLSVTLGDRALLRRHPEPIFQRMESFNDTIANIEGLDVDTSTGEALLKSLFQVKDKEVRMSLEALLNKCLLRAKYFVPGKANHYGDSNGHYYYNVPLFTHFNAPLRRYADLIVHRQLKSVLTGSEYSDDVDSIAAAADLCNFKKDAAKNAQEQSIHLYLSQVIDGLSSESGHIIRDAIIIQVYESAFDVLIPEFGIEKRVHGDQLPLVKAEFHKPTRLLELYWEKGVDSATFTPADESENNRRNLSISRKASGGNRPRASSAASAAAQEVANSTAVATQGINDLSVNDSKSVPSSPKDDRSSQSSHKATSMSKMKVNSESSEDNSALKAYLEGVTIRQEGKNNIQEIRVLQHVPVLLRAEVGKSIPCLTVRTLNPFAV